MSGAFQVYSVRERGPAWEVWCETYSRGGELLAGTIVAGPVDLTTARRLVQRITGNASGLVDPRHLYHQS